MSMPQLQNLGLSGYAWVGVDVGGFAGDTTGELLTRWTEFGIFQPFCRNHSAWDTHPQEPWAFGEPYESQIRELLLLRRRLLPYLYTLFDEAHRTGAPILRPLLFEYPGDPETYSADDEFLLGTSLLVAPIGRPGTEYRHVYLPAGTWVHYWSGERFRGPAHLLGRAPLGQPALYVKANTPLPMGSDPLSWTVHVAQAESGSGALYDDAGEGFGFERGEFTRQSAVCEVEGGSVVVRLDGLGAPCDLDVRGVRQPTRVTIDGVETTEFRFEDDRLVLRLDGEGSREVRIDAMLT